MHSRKNRLSGQAISACLKSWIGQTLIHNRKQKLGCRMLSHLEMDHAPAFMCQDHEHVQDPEAQSRHHEKIDRHQLLDMVLQEGPPRLRWRFAVLHHVFCSRCLGHFDAEFQLFPMDSRCAPRCVSSAHISDEISNRLGRIGSSRAEPATLPRPIEPKSLSMPCEHCFWFDNQKGAAPVRPQTAEPYPKQPVRSSQVRTLLGRSL
jgi:hypothetical protein